MKPSGAPGGLLVLVAKPTIQEDQAGRVGVTPQHNLVASYLAKFSGLPTAIDSVVRCQSVEAGNDTATNCAGYLANAIALLRPTRIVTIGSLPAYAVLGRDVAILQNRRGYGWLTSGAVPIPVFTLRPVWFGATNALLKQQFTEDLKWAATYQPDLPPWDQTLNLVETVADTDEALLDIQCSGEDVTIDFETYGELHTPEHKQISWSLTLTESEQTWVWDAASLDLPGVRAKLGAFLADPSIGKYAQNAKFEIESAHTTGLEFNGLRGDTRIWRKLLDSEAPADLATMQELVGMGGGKDILTTALTAQIAAQHAAANVVMSNLAQTLPSPPKTSRADRLKTLLTVYAARLTDEQRAILRRSYNPEAWAYGYIEADLLSTYNALDTVSTARLVRLFRGQLLAQDKMYGWDAVFGPSVEAFAAVESWGFPVNVMQLQLLTAYFGTKILDIETNSFARYKDFNPASPASVGRLLFSTLGLKPTEFSKKTGKPSTSNDVLLNLQNKHPIVADLISHRQLSKMKNQYADGLQIHIGNDGRIHTTYNIDGARSGRTSSSDPNLQNIPTRASDLAKQIKRAFQAPPGYVLIFADFKQLEFRIAADLSGDPEMAKVFMSGIDFHQATAELIAPIVWRIPTSAVTSEHRRAAKTFNFGILYGMADSTIAENAGCTLDVAASIRQAVTGKFRVFAGWIQDRLRETRKSGQTWTWWGGRRAYARQLPAIADQDNASRKNAENASYNTPVQGTANFYNSLSIAAMVKWCRQKKNSIEVVASVHDSIGLLVPAELVDMAAAKLRAVMTGHKTMTNVPLEVDVEVGRNWGDLVPYVFPVT